MGVLTRLPLNATRQCHVPLVLALELLQQHGAGNCSAPDAALPLFLTKLQQLARAYKLVINMA